MFIEGIMSKSDKDKFSEIDKMLEFRAQTHKKLLDKDKEQLGLLKPELEQLVRWWNLKMDELNWMGKFRLTEDYYTKTYTNDSWAIHLQSMPDKNMGLRITIHRSGYRGYIYSHYYNGKLKYRYDANRTYNHSRVFLINGELLISSLTSYLVNIIKSRKKYQDAIADK